MSKPVRTKHFERKVADNYTKDIPGPGTYTPTTAALNAQLKIKGASFKFYQNERKIVVLKPTS